MVIKMADTNGEINSILKRYEPIADMIHATFGSNCEVVVHDLSNVQSSLVYIQGNVTGREVGAPTTEVILKQLRQHGNEVKDKLGFTTRTTDGKMVKTSISFIRNDEGEVIGYLGINFDITAFSLVNQVMKEFTTVYDAEENSNHLDESYAKNIDEVFHHLISSVTLEIGVPIPEMSRNERIRFVQKLEERGAFLIQGSGDRIATVLGVSKQTIYNYLE
ncbi:helix-turn-helix transcriptional regulator [Sporosarcina luteola]|uniref:helix-turn-helix transcriptional regulator n=1 Tax=Sporosarcina luteola TaxID=582850 RepID=UPI00203F01FC|nr:helix-turn-helix transcriptional regulator [Sporosarcina luteola]MCM3711925.1 helix-turn-helix transcriptional regulator [Sporosarcina luteola]